LPCGNKKAESQPHRRTLANVRCPGTLGASLPTYGCFIQTTGALARTSNVPVADAWLTVARAAIAAGLVRAAGRDGRKARSLSRPALASRPAKPLTMLQGRCPKVADKAMSRVPQRGSCSEFAASESEAAVFSSTRAPRYPDAFSAAGSFQGQSEIAAHAPFSANRSTDRSLIRFARIHRTLNCDCPPRSLKTVS
jgi:hypothetical protein